MLALLSKMKILFSSKMTLVLSAVFFAFSIFKAGCLAEKIKRSENSLKKKKQNKKIYKKISGEYGEIKDINVSIDRVNNL